MRVCPHCGAAQPSTFDAICANCGNLLEQAALTDSSTAITSEPPPPVEPKRERRPRPVHRCPKCQATQIIHDVQLSDSGHHRLEATVHMNPDALVFTGAISRSVTARVCGQCGFLEFYVENPAELLNAARQAPERYGMAEAPSDRVAENVCLACGAAMPEDVSKCSACGWTYVASEGS